MLIEQIFRHVYTCKITDSLLRTVHVTISEKTPYYHYFMGDFSCIWSDVLANLTGKLTMHMHKKNVHSFKIPSLSILQSQFQMQRGDHESAKTNTHSNRSQLSATY